jgi:hypothetical protein
MTEDDRPITRKDLDELKAALRDELKAALQSGFSEQMRDIETALLKTFHGYALGATAQFQKLTAVDGATETRLTALEGRVLELETRRRSQ